MRTKFTLRNSSVGFISSLLITAASFVVRTFFIKQLGTSVLGFHSLIMSFKRILSFQDVLVTVFSYSFYASLAHNNQISIRSLLKYVRKVYLQFAFFVLLTGLIILPLLPRFSPEYSDFPQYSVAYLLMLFHTVIIYPLYYRRVLIIADQQNYRIAPLAAAAIVIQGILQIIILVKTSNYTAYLSILAGIVLIESFVINKVVQTRYPFIRHGETNPVPKSNRKKIRKDIQGAIMHNVGHHLSSGINDVLISTFLGFSSLGLISNFQLINRILWVFSSGFLRSSMSSFGNLFAVNDRRKEQYRVFTTFYYITFTVYSWTAVCFFILANDFVVLWIGSEFTQPLYIVMLIVGMYFIDGLKTALETIKSAGGIFYVDRFVPVLQVAVNLILSIALVKPFGLPGILIGSLLANVFVSFLLQGYFVHKFIFKVSLINHLITSVAYAGLTAISAVFSYMIVSRISMPLSFFRFLFFGLIGTVVTVSINLIVFGFTERFRDTWRIVRHFAGAGKKGSENSVT